MMRFFKRMVRVPCSCYKVLFFDIHNVLARLNLPKLYRQIASYCQIQEEEVQETLQVKGWADSYERGLVDSRTLFHQLPAQIQGKGGFSGWFSAISDVLEPDDALNPLLKQLKQQGIRLWICSNICEAHFSYAYTHFSTLHLFEDFVLSYEEKVRKPEELLYKRALEKAGVSKEEAWFVEGSSTFVKQASLLGLHATLYQSPLLLQQELMQQGLLS